MERISRRRFLAISAAACLPTTGRAMPVAEWRGVALGAQTKLALAGVDTASAAPVFAAVSAELERIEALFSLYRSDSALVRLNAQGRLANPAPEMLELLATAMSIHHATDGVFDPAVQPIFAAIAEWRSAPTVQPFSELRYDPENITMPDGMAITLNGIAQGYATDCIKALLIDQGLTNVVADMGEVAVWGGGAFGAGWPVTLPDGSTRNLTTGAVATSRLTGTMVNGQGHILRRDGQFSEAPDFATVVASSATLADGWSTALAVSSPEERAAWDHFLSEFEVIIG
ncbi:hypothetical protein B9057_15850 (plasmid) [Aestuarium zhoushanense]|nr:hypothetical protein B9057_15850 [Aestuarium zhoushanense]